MNNINIINDINIVNINMNNINSININNIMSGEIGELERMVCRPRHVGLVDVDAINQCLECGVVQSCQVSAFL